MTFKTQLNRQHMRKLKRNTPRPGCDLTQMVSPPFSLLMTRNENKVTKTGSTAWARCAEGGVKCLQRTRSRNVVSSDNDVTSVTDGTDEVLHRLIGTVRENKKANINKPASSYNIYNRSQMLEDLDIILASEFGWGGTDV